jgi:hypothetical protein
VCLKVPPGEMNENQMIDASTEKASVLTTSVVAGGSHETNATTSFENDAAVAEASYRIPKMISRLFFGSSEDSVPSSIQFYLAKPQILSSGTLLTTDISSTFPLLNLPAAMVNRPVVRDKLSGYFGFRATMVFRLQVNGSRFQQGRYILAYIPTGGEATGPATNGSRWVELHTNTLKARTQLPHVELDVNCDTEAILRVPFNSVLDFYVLSNRSSASVLGNWGCLRMFPYIAISAASGPTTCFYTLWSHFEDVELIGQTLPITAQSGGGFASTPSEKEAKKKNVGPIESTTLRLSKALGFLKPVPMLSSYVTPIKWAVDITSNVASVFGWSAPPNLEPACRMQRIMYAYATNTDKVDQSLPLGLTSSNAVNVSPGFSGTDVDELDIVRFCQIPSYYFGFAWTTSNSAGINLYSLNLEPSQFLSTRTYLTGQVVDHTPLSYIASKFGYWRGSIKINFKIIKTEFHSGRLAVCFTPNDAQGVNLGAPTLPLSEYLHRDVIDVRESNEFTLTFPFISPKGYLPAGESFGRMDVFVLDPLIAPSTVSTAVAVVLESSSCEDIEFSVLNNFAQSPVAAIVAQSGGAFDRSDCAIVSKNIGSTSSQPVQTVTAETCIGEKITSLRLLLKRFYTLKSRIHPIDPDGLRMLNVIPFGCQLANAPPITFPEPFYMNDLYGELTSIFLYSRGGVRFKFNPVFGATTPASVCASLVYHNGPWSTPDIIDAGVVPYGSNAVRASTLQARFSTTYHTIKEDSQVEVSVPQYSKFHSRNNASHLVGIPSYAVNGTTLSTPTSLCIYPNDIEPSTITLVSNVCRAGADDVNFGGFVSIPPMFMDTAS